MKHNFEERKQNRIEYAKSQAEKNLTESNTTHEHANKLSSFIPPGQPILIGHHSERRHRAHLKKIDNAMRKSIDCQNKAEYYKNKAESIENNTAIFSDDPNALDKLKLKLEALESLQELMKATNNIIRKNKTEEKRKEALKNIGFSDERIAQLLTPKFNGIGYPSYKLTNNNANMRRIKERIKQLEKVATLETKEEIIQDIKILLNVEANRVQIFFPSIPSENTRKKLKSRGFRWCRSEQAWQRHLNQWAFIIAKELVTESLNDIR
jgi:hypothetical protein